MSFRWTGAKPARHGGRVSFLFALLACWFAGTPSLAATVERIDVRADRITVRFDQDVADASAFLVRNPQRIALDVDGATPGGTVHAEGAVSGIRERTNGVDGARIVFDLAQPAIVTEGRFGKDARTLTLMLRTVDDASFSRAAAEHRLRFLPPFQIGSANVARKYSVSLPIPAVAHALPLPRIYGDDASRPLVVIDAGHGGHDPGAISPTSGLREKDVTLKIALAIRDALVRSGRARVALTREDDRFLVLQERDGLARRMHADLFISIHCDSVGAGEASGASVYTLSEVASDKEAARLAARENKADIIAGVDLGAEDAAVSSILIDLSQRETMNASADFARLLGREAQPLIGMKPNFHRMASLMVLKAPDMPSVLFETGYISNPKDAAFLDSTEGRRRIAESIVRAVQVHFARRMVTGRMAANDIRAPQPGTERSDGE